MFGAIAGIQRRLVVKHARKLATARARGKVFGRPPLDRDMLAYALS